MDGIISGCYIVGSALEPDIGFAVYPIAVGIAVTGIIDLRRVDIQCDTLYLKPSVVAAGTGSRFLPVFIKRRAGLDAVLCKSVDIEGSRARYYDL